MPTSGATFDRTFGTPDGTALAYTDHGEGRPLVFLPGLGMSGRHFRRQEPLVDEFRVITVDPRGHGRSARTEVGLTLAQTATDVHDLLVHLDLTDVVLVGWSMGSFVLYEYLRAFGADRVAGVCTVDMTPRNHRDVDWELAVFGDLVPAGIVAAAGGMVDDKQGWLRELVRACFADGRPPDEGVVDDLLAACEDVSLVALLAFWTDLGRSDWRAFVAEIAVPTLVVHGARSVAVPPDSGRWLASAIPDARLVILPESGHLPFFEQAEEFNAALRDFAHALDARAAAR